MVAASYSPRFIKKRGPPKTPRLAYNSLFPATGRLVNARRAAFRHRYFRAGKHDSSSDEEDDNEEDADAAPKYHERAPRDNDQFLNTEDLSISGFSLARWNPPTYELRMDEMDVFNVCLNNSDLADRGGILFLYGAPTMPFTEELRNIDWSEPLSMENVRSCEKCDGCTADDLCTAPKREDGVPGILLGDAYQPQYQPPRFLSIVEPSLDRVSPCSELPWRRST